MKRRPSMLVFLLVCALTVAPVAEAFANARFEATPGGILYVVRDEAGQIVRTVRPSFNPLSGTYEVRDEQQRVIARQKLPSEAPMDQIRLLTPVEGSSHSVRARDAMGNMVPVLREMSASDPRFAQLRDYINNDPGLRRVIAMHMEARQTKIDAIQRRVAAGTKDPKLAAWLTNDLRKPVYLEVGDSGGIYHDPRGFVLATRGADGQISYRDNSHANRLVVPPNSEVFTGGKNDASAATVIAHEIGHMILDQMHETPNYPRGRHVGPHSKNQITDEGFALSEGWAGAIETIAGRGRYETGTSWRLRSQRNISDNRYVYKNQGVVDGPDDGILKTGLQQLSTSGVNSTLFYRKLLDQRIQVPYAKILQVFEQRRPQTYREFLKNYIEMFPEDRSHVIRRFLETTKYTTVDSTAGARYKAVHDARRAVENAPDGATRARLKAAYRAKRAEYTQWKERLYQQAVVDGQIDRAIGPEGEVVARTPSSPDEIRRRFRQQKLSETLLRGRRALGVGLERAADSIRQSFSVRSVAMTAGSAIAVNVASQIFSGERVCVERAFRSVASLQFVGNVVGSTMGAAAGHVIAPLIQTFVPIPIVGAIAGSLLPTLTSIAGGQFGGGLGAGMSLREALRSLDPVAIAGQAAGSTVGAMLGAMIPIPVLGPMLGSIVGGILGERLFTGIARLFGHDRRKRQKPAAPPPMAMPAGVHDPVAFQAAGAHRSPPAARPTDPHAGLRIDPSIDSVPIERMIPQTRALKEQYEALYRAYVEAMNAGNQAKAQQILRQFIPIRDRYRRALSAYIKR